MRTSWLENLNLSPSEIKVMNVLLDIQMPKSVPFIVKKSGLPRATVVDILNKFQERKLADKVPRASGYKGRYNKRFNWRKTIIVLK